jgi:DNA mismatch repair protein MutS
MIYDEYVEYTAKYKTKYGSKTLVLMEVGSFWEIYDCDQHLGADMKAVCELLNIQMSRKNKNIPDVSAKNPLMAGFPNYTLKKFLPVLVQDSFTIVLVSQVTPPPNPKREVTQVISKGTYVEDISSCMSNHLLCVYTEALPYLACSASVIDLSTGISNIIECSSHADDKDVAFDKLVQFINVYKPAETLLIGHNTVFDEAILFALHEHKSYVHNMLGQSIESFANKDYQCQLLQKAFPRTGLLTPAEYIDLERNALSLTCFTRLLDFAYQHDEGILQKLSKPRIQFGEHDEKVHLSPCLARHLELQGLMEILNRCKTAVGKRGFVFALSNPTHDPQKLEMSYSLIEQLLGNPDLLASNRKKLEDVYDVERIFRRISTGRMQPVQLKSLRDSLEIASKVLDQVFPGYDTQTLQEFVEYLDDFIIYDVSDRQRLEDLTASFFRAGKFPELDVIQNNIQTILEAFASVMTHLNEHFPACNFKLEVNDREGFFVSCTSKRFNDLAKHQIQTLPSIPLFEDSKMDFKALKVSSTVSNYVRLSSPELRHMNARLDELRDGMKTSLRDVWIQYQGQISDTFGHWFETISRDIAEADILTTNAANALDYKYVKPKLSIRSNKSYVHFKSIRHPIIERILDSVPYVTNDIDIGTHSDSTVKHDGIVLYGLNAAGKSSLMKAVGLNLVMAQAGMFVASESMELCPYHQIFTRITQSDNLYRGQSTFMVEMSELRNILRRANSKSIVLGDELCAGTESVSATAIVASGIVELCERKCSFVFASHLHGIPDLDIIKPIANLAIFHLHVHCDEHGRLVYDRKLRHGSGNTLYGLEVCKALDMDPSFINRALQIRRRLIGLNENIVPSKKSKYNAKLYVDRCSVCGSNTSVQVHHIQERSSADKQGFVSHEHKNKKSNLVCLCESCHVSVHHGKLQIDGFVTTSSGIQLVHSTQ